MPGNYSGTAGGGEVLMGDDKIHDDDHHEEDHDNDHHRQHEEHHDNDVHQFHHDDYHVESEVESLIVAALSK